MYSICSFLAISSVISNVHGSVVKRTVCSEPTEFTSEQIQAALDAHNLHRGLAGDAADMLKLVWSDQMASGAQAHANLCSIDGLSQCDPNEETGQNAVWLTDRPTVSTDDIATVVQQWVNEKQYYNFTTGNCSDNEVCSHYKQVVWAQTSEVGCGNKRCTLFAQPPNFLFEWIFVCYYNPGGNIGDRQNPYRQGKPCSKCNKRITGTWCCENNLCLQQSA